MIRCPFAWLDLQALDHNIAYVAQACGSKRIRIATKSIRSVAALRYIEQHLQNVCGFMTFTAEETIYLLEQGFDHLLLGYPVAEVEDMRAIATYIQRGNDITFMVDCAAHVAQLEQIGAALHLSIPICIDVNISTDLKVLYFGTKRSPITTKLALQQLLQDIDSCTHVHIAGMMAYDAQIAGVTDKTTTMLGAKATLIRQLKKQAQPKLATLRQQFIDIVQQHTPLQFINGGGSGSMTLCAAEPSITEITVGSAFFAPALFSQYEQLDLQPAAGFALRITRQFDAHTFVCHGGGYIASGAIGADRLPQFLEPHVYRFLPLEGAGEVQTPIISKRAHRIGDIIHFRHAKAGELCERFHTLHVFNADEHIDDWTTYRGDGQCFL